MGITKTIRCEKCESAAPFVGINSTCHNCGHDKFELYDSSKQKTTVDAQRKRWAKELLMIGNNFMHVSPLIMDECKQYLETLEDKS